jgi:preprotein translocase subunit SecG
MIELIAFLLTTVLVVDCLVLMLLILVQLPKKEAGAGIAFGAGTADALFGAGSGNALTKMTKYAATVFLVLSVVLSAMSANRGGRATRSLEKALESGAPAAAPALAPAQPAAVGAPGASTNLLITAPTNPAAAK